MHEASFWKLYDIIEPKLPLHPARKNEKIGGAPNGFLASATRLNIAIRYFAGGDPNDISLIHQVSYAEVFNSAWMVVDAVNALYLE